MAGLRDRLHDGVHCSPRKLVSVAQNVLGQQLTLFLGQQKATGRDSVRAGVGHSDRIAYTGTTVVMAAAWHGGVPNASNYVNDPSLLSAISSAMDYWFVNDFTDSACLDQGGLPACPCGTLGFWNTNWFSNVSPILQRSPDPRVRVPLAKSLTLINLPAPLLLREPVFSHPRRSSASPRSWARPVTSLARRTSPQRSSATARTSLGVRSARLGAP